MCRWLNLSRRSGRYWTFGYFCDTNVKENCKTVFIYLAVATFALRMARAAKKCRCESLGVLKDGLQGYNR